VNFSLLRIITTLTLLMKWSLMFSKIIYGLKTFPYTMEVVKKFEVNCSMHVVGYNECCFYGSGEIFVHHIW